MSVHGPYLNQPPGSRPVRHRFQPKAPPIDGLAIVPCEPWDPHYPEPGHVCVDGAKMYVRADEVEKIVDALRKS